MQLFRAKEHLYQVLSSLDGPHLISTFPLTSGLVPTVERIFVCNHIEPLAAIAYTLTHILPASLKTIRK
jgi:hypothetical protein